MIDDASAEGAPDTRPRAIIAGHGDFATGLVSAVEQITGRGHLLLPIVTRALGSEEIADALRDAMEKTQATVVFTDLPAGSCTIAARRLQRERSDLLVVTGANVPALLDFVFQAALAPSDAAVRAAEKGRGALTLVGRRGD